MEWSVMESDSTIQTSSLDGVQYYVCNANGMVSWWTEFMDPPHYVSSLEDAKSEAEREAKRVRAALSGMAPVQVYPFENAPPPLRAMCGPDKHEGWVVILDEDVRAKALPAFLSNGGFFSKDSSGAKVEELTSGHTIIFF